LCVSLGQQASQALTAWQKKKHAIKTTIKTLTPNMDRTSPCDLASRTNMTRSPTSETKINAKVATIAIKRQAQTGNATYEISNPLEDRGRRGTSLDRFIELMVAAAHPP
jgi:hypothetical protein